MSGFMFFVVMSVLVLAILASKSQRCEKGSTHDPKKLVNDDDFYDDDFDPNIDSLDLRSYNNLFNEDR